VKYITRGSPRHSLLWQVTSLTTHPNSRSRYDIRMRGRWQGRQSRTKPKPEQVIQTRGQNRCGMSWRYDTHSHAGLFSNDLLVLEHLGCYPDNAAFSEYARMVTDLTWKIPDNISFEQAATVTVGLYSAAMCMTHPKRLNMVEWPDKVSDEQWVSNIKCCPLVLPTAFGGLRALWIL